MFLSFITVVHRKAFACGRVLREKWRRYKTKHTCVAVCVWKHTRFCKVAFSLVTAHNGVKCLDTQFDNSFQDLVQTFKIYLLGAVSGQLACTFVSKGFETGASQVTWTQNWECVGQKSSAVLQFSTRPIGCNVSPQWCMRDNGLLSSFTCYFYNEVHGVSNAFLGNVRPKII